MVAPSHVPCHMPSHMPCHMPSHVPSHTEGDQPSRFSWTALVLALKVRFPTKPLSLLAVGAGRICLSLCLLVPKTVHNGGLERYSRQNF